MTPPPPLFFFYFSPLSLSNEHFVSCHSPPSSLSFSLSLSLSLSSFVSFFLGKKTHAKELANRQATKQTQISVTTICATSRLIPQFKGMLHLSWVMTHSDTTVWTSLTWPSQPSSTVSAGDGIMWVQDRWYRAVFTGGHAQRCGLCCLCRRMFPRR